MCVILSATVALCCLFMPKIWLVLMHPEKCARALPGSKGGGTGTGSGAGMGPKSIGNNHMGSVRVRLWL